VQSKRRLRRGGRLVAEAGYLVPGDRQHPQQLEELCSRVRRAFRDIASLHKKVSDLVDERYELAHQINKIYWHITLSRVAAESKKQGVL
jgi:hypothetical protein